MRPVMYEDATRVLAELAARDGMRLGLVSSHPNDHLRAEADAYGVAHLFHAVVGSSRDKSEDMARVLAELEVGAGEALYQRAKVAIADNVYPEQQNYTSNRPIQVLMAGGAVLLHQHVPKMDVLLGIQPGVHYLEWHTLDDLRTLITDALASDTRDMVQAGRAYAETHHTYDARVRQLMEYLA
jgi:hypothetical protein